MNYTSVQYTYFYLDTHTHTRAQFINIIYIYYIDYIAIADVHDSLPIYCVFMKNYIFYGIFTFEYFPQFFVVVYNWIQLNSNCSINLSRHQNCIALIISQSKVDFKSQSIYWIMLTHTHTQSHLHTHTHEYGEIERKNE